MIAYKLVRVGRDGNLYPLFIDRNRPYLFGEHRVAEYIPTKGFAPRLGFHCCFTPYAPHLKQDLKSGERRVWIQCEIDDFKTYPRPPSQGGEWILAQKLVALRIVSNEEVEKLLSEAV